MARTPSNMIPLGSKIQDYQLLDTVSGELLSTSQITTGANTLVMFICNHCPFVIHLHDGLKALYADYKGKDVNFVAVSSNDIINYPDDAPDKMTTLFKDLGLGFPYLYDEKQEFAKSLDAACTPDFFLFDSSQQLVYRGRFDSSTPGNNEPVTGADIRQALDALLSGEDISSDQLPSIGCNIKWL